MNSTEDLAYYSDLQGVEKVARPTSSTLISFVTPSYYAREESRC